MRVRSLNRESGSGSGVCEMRYARLEDGKGQGTEGRQAPGEKRQKPKKSSQGGAAEDARKLESQFVQFRDDAEEEEGGV